MAPPDALCVPAAEDAADGTDRCTLEVAECVTAACVAPGPLRVRAYAEQVPATVTAAAVPMVASLRP